SSVPEVGRVRRVPISEITRLTIIDELGGLNISWAGRLTDVEFLSTLYDLEALPSTDTRYRDAAGDIRQHRINNDDWDDDWVFYDSRFGLQHGDDETFLRFLAQTVHPTLRRDADTVASLV